MIPNRRSAALMLPLAFMLIASSCVTPETPAQSFYAAQSLYNLVSRSAYDAAVEGLLTTEQIDQLKRIDRDANDAIKMGGEAVRAGDEAKLKQAAALLRAAQAELKRRFPEATNGTEENLE